MRRDSAGNAPTLPRGNAASFHALAAQGSTPNADRHWLIWIAAGDHRDVAPGVRVSRSGSRTTRNGEKRLAPFGVRGRLLRRLRADQGLSSDVRTSQSSGKKTLRSAFSRNGTPELPPVPRLKPITRFTVVT